MQPESSATVTQSACNWLQALEGDLDTSHSGFLHRGSFSPQDMPQGTFTFINPTGRKYSMPEVVDLINEGLLSQKYVLVRRNHTYTLISAVA